jgi:MFS family permease
MGMIRRGLALIFKRRDFGLLMATQYAAQAGDGIVQTALAKYVVFGGQEGFDVEAAENPEELLRIVLIVFIPYTILSPFLGVVIDRWDRRRLLAVANGLRGVAVALVGLLGMSVASGDDLTGLLGSETLPSVVLFLIFMLTLASTRVVLAAKAAALPSTLDGSGGRLVEGNAVSQLGGALFQLGGAGAAFVASTIVDVAPIVVVGAAVYVVGAFAATMIERASEVRVRSSLAEEVASVVRNIAVGLREVSRRPKAAAAITTYFWLRLLWSFALVGIGFIARDLIADDDIQVLVVTGGAGAAGAVLGFVLAPRLNVRARSSAQLVLAASSVAGVAVAVLGAVEMQLSLAVLTFFLGFGFFLGKISLDTMVQEALGDDFRGRAFSLYDIAYNMAWVIAAALLKLFWSESVQGVLIAGMGLVFLVGMAALAAWYRRAGLLAPIEPAAAPAK